MIVILSILATIAFMSFGSQSSSARDSTRLSDLSQVSKALATKVVVSWTYPLPDKYVQLLNGIQVIWYQWEVWDSIKRIINTPATTFQDPLDKINYTYVVNSWKNKAQFLTFLENQNSISINYEFTSDNLDATSYTSRYPFVKWDALWIVLATTWSTTSPTYTPIQDVNVNTNWLTNSWIDLSSWTLASLWVVAELDNSSSVATSSNLTTTITNLTKTGSSNPVVDNSIVLKYDMNTLNWAKLKDLSWNWNDATLNGTSLTWSQNTWFARYFNWSSDYLTIPDSSSLDMTWSMTISIWVRPDVVPTWADYRWLMIKRDAVLIDNYAILLHWWISWRFHWQTYNWTYLWAWSTNPPTVWNWYNYVYTYDYSDKNIRIYTNWILENTTGGPNNLIDNNATIYMWWYPWNNYFKWKIWEVIMYKRALSSSEISTYYNNNK